MEKKLYRSRRERMISGVCGGIAEYFEADPTLVRLVAVLLTLVSFGSAIVAYIVMSIVVPEEPLQGVTEGGPAVSYSTEESAGSSDPRYATPQGVATAPPPPPPVSAPSRAPEPGRPRRRGGIAVGLVLVFIGLALLAAQFMPDIDLWRLWPLIIVIVGIRAMFRGGDD